jgi:NAD(P)-dependent dehydrogenase (short-subunit alcohol dehydrogenase family)
MSRVAGKVAIITGAAGGIGRATAALFAQEGATVRLVDIDQQKVLQASAELAGQASASGLDVRSESAWAALFESLISDYGRVDILVNNAGVLGDPKAGDLEALSLEDWRAVQAVNVEGVLLGCRQFVAAMGGRGGGSIVNVSSMAGLTATPGLMAYGASKAAVRQITQSVALHCLRKGYKIRCNSIHPGFIDTEMVERAFTSDVRKQLVDSVPMRAFGRPEDVAQAALYLASEESRYVTGTRLVVDGGVTMQ